MILLILILIISKYNKNNKIIVWQKFMCDCIVNHGLWDQIKMKCNTYTSKLVNVILIKLI